MSDSPRQRPRSSRRTFLKAAAAVTAGTVLSPRSLWGQSLPGINQRLMITPEQAWDWHVFKSQCGPTYAGSAGWKRFTEFLVSKMPEFGAVDLDYVEIPYDHYIVDDWPDRRTHQHGSGKAVEQLVTDGTPVPAVASYGMTSGSTPPEGVTARMVFYDPAHPPRDSDIAGKILVCQSAPQPAPPYSNSFLDNYTLTDYEWRSPGKWAPLFTPPPTSVTTSYHSRWVWSQLNRFAAAGIKGHAAGIVVVYDLSPGAAFGLAQRSVYTPDGRAGLGATYVNCPTLTLDRVNGAKVVADAKAGKIATLTLTARFQRDTGKAILAHLPGRNYGTPQDQQVLLATHTDAMSLIEENGGFGLLGIMSYFNRVPRAERPRTLTFYFDCRHFMPGGEASWPQFDYYTIHPEKLTSIVATIGVEHMGGRQTIETGPGGNQYAYSAERPEDGGVITSLMDVHNNNIWLVEAIARAATANAWPRVDVKSGNTGPGVNGGFQGTVKSPMNKGRAYKIPGIGLAGDWPGAWTQTYAQVDTEAGPHGFDKNYFVQQVAGLAQIAGELMRVDPRVIDLGWGELKLAIVAVKDTGLLDQYVAAFRHVEAGARDKGAAALKDLSTSVASLVSATDRAAITKLVDTQLAKLI
ncbi:MAG: twin-arginine translocation signal domain-containing protein [Acidobacteriia bacterium]|nr:twin-arginine translocation signal domain-containing protein [Terriglobia bacterium]